MKMRSSLVALLLVCTTACSGGSPSGTVKEFYARVEAGKLDATLELLSNQARSQVSSDKMKQGLQEATRQIDAKGGIKRIDVIEEKVIGETAEVNVRITFGNGSEETDQSSLIKEDGKWRIQPSVGGK